MIRLKFVISSLQVASCSMDSRRVWWEASSLWSLFRLSSTLNRSESVMVPSDLKDLAAASTALAEAALLLNTAFMMRKRVTATTQKAKVRTSTMRWPFILAGSVLLGESWGSAAAGTLETPGLHIAGDWGAGRAASLAACLLLHSWLTGQSGLPGHSC